MMRKRVLFISPRISNMYQDIMSQLARWDMEVDYIEDKTNRYDPNYLRSDFLFFTDNCCWKKIYSNTVKKGWIELLSHYPYNKAYDYLLIIDGQNLHPYLFDELRKRNPHIWIANYLYDSTKSLYRFQENFKQFDRIASFDKQDCREFGLSFLPIYWCEPGDTSSVDYDLFGFGGYGPERYALFTEIDLISKSLGFNSFIKLYFPKIKDVERFIFKQKVRRILRMNTHINMSHYYSDLITHNSLPSSEFRRLIYQSKIIIDSVNFYQDGMTARFMWALGAGKKILTTNANIKNYECYDPNQIFVLNDLKNISANKDFLNFLMTDYLMKQSRINRLLPWRIDNWLIFLLNI